MTSARVLAGVAGASACFMAGGLAQERLTQVKLDRPLVTAVRENVSSSAPFSSTTCPGETHSSAGTRKSPDVCFDSRVDILSGKRG